MVEMIYEVQLNYRIQIETFKTMRTKLKLNLNHKTKLKLNLNRRDQIETFKIIKTKLKLCPNT